MSLYPKTTRTLKILLPITLLAARESLPFKIELKLTNNSGELVPRETTVKPITIWGIPKIKDKNMAPCIKNSPPAKSRTMPKTTRTLKILLPITLLAASESLPFKIELKLTNNSGELVPRETTVNPITIWGIPKIKDKNIAPWIKNSPPAKSRTTPKNISIIGNKKSLIFTLLFRW